MVTYFKFDEVPAWKMKIFQMPEKPEPEKAYASSGAHNYAFREALKGFRVASKKKKKSRR